MTLFRRYSPRQTDDQLKVGSFSRHQLVVVLLLFASIFYNFYLLRASWPSHSSHLTRGDPYAAKEVNTLVVYVFRNVDPEALNNLFFFLEYGVQEDDGARYIIAMDPGLPEQETPKLPSLPSNAEIVRPPSCFEMGVVGWLLYSSGRVTISNYRHFVWVSSLVRGPFLPIYQQTPWHSLLTERLQDDVKLVGATISCTVLVIDTAQAPISHPHIQNYLMATDSTGLALLKKVGALDCHNNWLDNVRFAEFGASAAVMKAGYNLESLMLRYQGVDWRNESNWKCNARMDPLQQDVYDGTSVNALEVMFVKTDYVSLVVDIPHVSQATLYSRWRWGGSDVNGNAWIHEAARMKQSVLSRPQACFDAEVYKMGSPVEFKEYSAAQAYEHFVAVGFREGRPYMFSC